MTRQNVQVVNELGLHLRAAAQIVQVTTPAACPVWLSLGNATVDAKSLLGITSLVAQQGSDLVVSASGDGAEDVVKKVVQLIQSGFGDPK